MQLENSVLCSVEHLLLLSTKALNGTFHGAMMNYMVEPKKSVEKFYAIKWPTA